MADRLSRLELAQLHSGDLEPERARELLARLEASPTDAGRLGELRRNAAEYEQTAGRELAELRQRLEREPVSRAWWRRPMLLVPAALVGAAAALTIVMVRPRLHPPVGEDVSFRGALAVRIVARHGSAQLIVQPGQELTAGDALRFLVTTAAPGYLSVFSIDGAGKLSSFYPEDAAAPPLRLAGAGQHELPGSVVLDDAPGPERIVVVFSPSPFDRGSVQERARTGRLDARQLGNGGAVETISIGKRRGTPP